MIDQTLKSLSTNEQFVFQALSHYWEIDDVVDWSREGRLMSVRMQQITHAICEPVRWTLYTSKNVSLSKWTSQHSLSRQILKKNICHSLCVLPKWSGRCAEMGRSFANYLKWMLQGNEANEGFNKIKWSSSPSGRKNEWIKAMKRMKDSTKLNEVIHQVDERTNEPDWVKWVNGTYSPFFFSPLVFQLVGCVSPLYPIICQSFHF